MFKPYMKHTIRPQSSKFFNLIIFISVLLFYNTSIVICEINTPVQDEDKQTLLKSKISYVDSSKWDVEYIFELYPDFSKIDIHKDLKLWIPVPMEWDSQKNIHIFSVDPKPEAEYKDSEYGNTFYYWNFSKYPQKTVYRVAIRFLIDSYGINAIIDTNSIKEYDKTSELYSLYTKSGHTIDITPKVRELTREAIQSEINLYRKAKLLYQFVEQKVHYKILDHKRGRGIKCLLDFPGKDHDTGEEYYEGCCNQMSTLFVAMCRSAGIPARCVFGFIGPKIFKKEHQLRRLQYKFELWED